MATKKQYWVMVYKPKMGAGYRYATTTVEPTTSTVPPSLMCMILVEAFSAHDAVCRAMLGQGVLVVGGRMKLEVVDA